MDILQKSDEEILAEAHRLREAYKLKRTLRYATVRDFTVHSESVAEHIFALIYLSHYFLQQEPIGGSLDKEKLQEIFLFHDFPEIKYGDVVTYHKTSESIAREQEAAKEVFAALPSSLQERAQTCWKEYEEHVTPEAQFAYALDKVEPIFELLDEINAHSMKRLKITYNMHVSNKLPHVKAYPVMKRFVEVITKELVAKDIFWKEE